MPLSQESGYSASSCMQWACKQRASAAILFLNYVATHGEHSWIVDCPCECLLSRVVPWYDNPGSCYRVVLKDWGEKYELLSWHTLQKPSVRNERVEVHCRHSQIL